MKGAGFRRKQEVSSKTKKGSKVDGINCAYFVGGGFGNEHYQAEKLRGLRGRAAVPGSLSACCGRLIWTAKTMLSRLVTRRGLASHGRHHGPSHQISGEWTVSGGPLDIERYCTAVIIIV